MSVAWPGVTSDSCSVVCTMVTQAMVQGLVLVLVLIGQTRGQEQEQPLVSLTVPAQKVFSFLVTPHYFNLTGGPGKEQVWGVRFGAGFLSYLD